MMTEASVLLPHLINMQCTAAIRELEANNTALNRADSAMDEFINAGSLDGKGYGALKSQMADFRLISDAKRMANIADLLDFEILRTAVGTDGSLFAYRNIWS